VAAGIVARGRLLDSRAWAALRRRNAAL